MTAVPLAVAWALSYKPYLSRTLAEVHNERRIAKLVFHEADACAMASLFSEKAALVGSFIPDVNDAIASAVKDWTGESREASDAALKRLEERGEALCTLLTSASEAMTKIHEEGNKAEVKAFAHLHTGVSQQLQGVRAPGATRGSGARGPAGCPEVSRPRRRSRGRPC